MYTDIAVLVNMLFTTVKFSSMLVETENEEG